MTPIERLQQQWMVGSDASVVRRDRLAVPVGPGGPCRPREWLGRELGIPCEESIRRTGRVRRRPTLCMIDVRHSAWIERRCAVEASFAVPSRAGADEGSVGHVVNGLKVSSVGVVDRERIEARRRDNVVGQ